MFTGLVTHLGEIRSVTRDTGGARFDIAADFDALALGESIAVDGCCLTVAALAGGGFRCEASAETLARTTLGDAKAAQRVHLERALALGDRLGGHIVTGHVDAVGRLLAKRPLGDAVEVTYEVPEALAPFIAPKGSIAVDGVSLTVNRVDGPRFDVVLVPYTRSATHLDRHLPEAAVNIETDVLAKYVARLLAKPGVDPTSGGVTLDLLARQGYV